MNPMISKLLSTISLIFLLYAMTYGQPTYIQYTSARQQFRVINVDPPLTPPKSSKPAVWGNYFWEFGDGHYSFDSVATHPYSKTGLYTVSLYLTPHYSYSDPLQYSRKLSVPASSLKPPEYSLGNQWVHLESNGGDYLVPGHDMQFVIHYQAPPSGAFDEGYVLLFLNNQRENKRFKINFDPISISNERFYYEEEALGNDFFSLPQQDISPKGLSLATELFNQHSDVRIIKVKNLREGEEKRFFCTISSDQRLENHQDKDRKLTISALWLPLNGTFEEDKKPLHP